MPPHGALKAACPSPDEDALLEQPGCHPRQPRLCPLRRHGSSWPQVEDWGDAVSFEQQLGLRSKAGAGAGRVRVCISPTHGGRIEMKCVSLGFRDNNEREREREREKMRKKG